MKADVTLNIYEAVEILRKELSARCGYTVEGITIMSWNTVVLQVVGETLEIPVRHHLRPDHAG